jgi:hypothetical protein
MMTALSRRSRFARWRFASALVALAVITGCGRGPLTPPLSVVPTGTIQFQMVVGSQGSGSITPAQGDYIIAINAVTSDGTSVNPGESVGMPTIAEALTGSFTHWDQDFVYGVDTLAQPFGFSYSYKVVGTGGVAIFVPIILTSNQFIFNPQLSTANGVNNTLSIQLPIAAFFIRGNPNSSNPPTVTSPPAVLLHVNYITATSLAPFAPTDQLGCCGVQTSGFDLVIDLTHAATYTAQLTTPPGKQGPANPNLFIAGGQITVSP